MFFRWSICSNNINLNFFKIKNLLSLFLFCQGHVSVWMMASEDTIYPDGSAQLVVVINGSCQAFFLIQDDLTNLVAPLVAI